MCNTSIMVFGHTPRGPLKILHDEFLSVDSPPDKNVLDYASQFRERLHRANSLASLSASKAVMKRNYDCASVHRHFEIGDKVLALLPIPGSALSAKFLGPYEIHDCLSDTDYVICTPERRRKTCVCHVNMMNSAFICIFISHIVFLIHSALNSIFTHCPKTFKIL